MCLCIIRFYSFGAATTVRYLEIARVKGCAAMADAKINHEDANAYWEGVDASVDGMLGGFPYLSRIDLQNSKNFLARCGIGGKDKDKVERAVDCGAGCVFQRASSL